MSEPTGRARTLALLGGLALLATLLASLMAPVHRAEAATLTACVKKKTGEMRLVSGKKAKKKCPKGWRKVTWNSEGPGVIRDKTGKYVGKLLGVYPAGAVIYVVERNGGQWLYLGSGELFGVGGGSPTFKAADCSGPAYLKNSGGPSTPQLIKVIGGPFRFMFRTSTSGFPTGPAQAWKSAGTFEPVINIPTYQLNSDTGVCEVDAPNYTGDLILLSSVPAPPDFQGPLRLTWR